MTNIEINHFVIFSLEAIIVAVLVLFLFRMRVRFGLTPLYVTLGVFQPIQTILAATVYVEIFPGVLVSPGSAIMFTASLFAFLLVYIFEGAIETRKAVYGILFANLTMALLLFIFGRQLALIHTYNLLNLSEEILYNTARMMLYGTLILFVDAVLLIMVYEIVWAKVKKNLFLRLFIAIILILFFDSLAFVTLIFSGQPNFVSILSSAIIGKAIVSAFYALTLTAYLRFAEKSGRHAREFRDVFDILSYRQKFELEHQRGKQTESLLRQSEEKFQTLATISPVGIFRTDQNGSTTYVNPKWCSLSGLSYEQALGDGWLESVHPDDQERINSLWQKTTRLKTGSSADYRFVRPDGQIAWVIGHVIPEKNANGEIIGYVGTITDITERKQAEEAISESEQRFRRLFQTSPDGLLLLDPHDPDTTWPIVDCNPTACQMSGYAREELIGQSIYKLDINKKSEHELADYLGNIRQEGAYHYETVHRHRDGHLYPVEILTSLFTYQGRELVLGIDRDITKRKQAEETLEKRAQELETLYQTSLEVNAQTDLDSLLQAIVQRAASLVGVGSGALYLMQDDNRTLQRVLAHNFKFPSDDDIIELGEGVTGKVAQSGLTLIVHDYETWEDRHSSLDGMQLHRFLGVPLKVQKNVIGVITMMDQTQKGPFSDEEIRLVSLFADQAAIAIENSTLYQDLQQSNVELTAAYDATIEGWSRALDLRDKETEGHTHRVAELTLKMAQAMNMSEAEIVHIRRGALLHDIGKMGVPDSILHKPDSLTDTELEIMRSHPALAQQMLLQIDFLLPALDIPLCHHEKWDGTGYPKGLKGEEIPLAARIFALVDVWDALTSDRPYRPAWSDGQALEYIRTQSGQHFDPVVVDIFLQLIDDHNK